jgi:single-stranded-DNA-specific exonuclease
MLITDHHDLPRRLPAAYAVVDPKMVPQGHPLRELPGVGVAYKLAELLCERAGTADEVSRYHDLVALGIVADVATQRGDVRYLLQRGLQALRHTERLGLQALMDIAELDPQWLTEEHIGYELAPRLNALGRLADATPSVEFLTTDDVARVRILAHELDGLNARRKLMCDQVVRAAEAQIERDRSLLERGALVLSHPSWPAGVIGIVAGRLAEKYRRPTILVATPPGKLARGSARSIEGCDISAAIAEHGDMLESFGGHPMAAGLSIDPARIPELRRAVSRTVCEICDQALAEEPVLEIDGYVPLSDLSIEFVREMERMAPFGPGNLSLTFAARGLSLTSHRKIGRTDEHLELVVEDEGGATQRVLWWRGETAALPGRHFDLAYTVRTTDYRGRRSVQVEWVDARPIAEPKALAHPRSPTIEVIDYRTASDPQERLRRLRSEREVVVWSEGKTEVRGRSRHFLESSDTLAIWTAPPAARELRDALERVSPTIVYLFGVDPGFDEPKSFLTRLAGLAKQAVVAQGGIVKLSTLTAATAQREETIQAGLAWLEARGDVTVLEDKGDEMRLGPGEGVTSADFSVAVSRLRSLLSETRAYRAYLARADAERLIRSIQSD